MNSSTQQIKLETQMLEICKNNKASEVLATIGMAFQNMRDYYDKPNTSRSTTYEILKNRVNRLATFADEEGA